MVEFPAVPLWKYAQRINYQECAFFGITHPDNIHYACSETWTQAQRDAAEQALLLAQEQIERVTQYPLTPKWIAGEYHPIKLTQGRRVNLYQASMGYVIEAGVMSDTMVEEDAIVNYALDPATVIVNNVTCSVNDIHVFHPNTDTEIFPTSKTLVADVLRIEMPWCRLLAEDYWWEPEPIMYADVLTWGAPAVDVRCIANDPSRQAIFHGRSDRQDCAGKDIDACMYIENPRYGLIQVFADDSVCARAESVELNYRAGTTSLTRVAEDAIIRLAHASMPTEPCGCAITQRLWARDREMPKYFLSRERINCPFGMSEGAWAAWIYANGQELVRGAIWA